METLHKYQLRDLFLGDSDLLYQDQFRAGTETLNPDARRIYGAELDKASNLFFRDLMQASKNKEIPESWKGIEAFEAIYSVFRDIPLKQITELNELGAGIRLREDHSGLNFRWDNHSMHRVGFKEWASDMDKGIDWEATKQAHGGVLRRGEHYKTGDREWKAFTKEEFLKDWWEESKNPIPPDAQQSNNVAGSFAKSRNVILKSDQEIPLQSKYSGHTNMGRLFIDQVRHRSEMIALVRTMGNAPIPNFKEAMVQLGLADKKDLPRYDKDGNYQDGISIDKSPVQGAGKFSDLSHKGQAEYLLSTLEYITGVMDNPADMRVSMFSKMFRQVSNIAYLPLSGISTVADIPLIALRVKQQGIEMGLKDRRFWDAYQKAFRRRFKNDDAAMREWFLHEGAGADAFNNAAARRIGAEGTRGPDVLSALNQKMFALNGLNTMTTVGQEAYMDLFTAEFGTALKSGNLSGRQKDSLQSFGFTDPEIDALSKYVLESPDGTQRIAAQNITDNTELRRKFREYASWNMKQAVIEPDPGSQAIVRGGQKAGTYAGEAFRNSFQYMSFPLGMTRVIARNLKNGYDGPWTSRSQQMAEVSAYIGSALAMAYFATVVRDLAMLREPMYLHNMTPKMWGRIVQQSGVMGILEPMLDMGSGNVRGGFAPLPRALYDMTLSAESAADAVDASRALQGANYPVVGPMSQWMIGKAFGESLNVLQEQKMRSAWRAQAYGQEGLFDHR